LAPRAAARAAADAAAADMLLWLKERPFSQAVQGAAMVLLPCLNWFVLVLFVLLRCFALSA